MLFLAAAGAGAIHGAGTMLAGAGMWAADLVLRRVYMARSRYQLAPGAATLTALPGGVTRITLPRKGAAHPGGIDFDFKGGQYVWVCVPAIALYEWHPFSISSAPGDTNSVTLHVRALGGWTKRLRQLASTSSATQVLLEGPAGAPAVDLDSARYKCVLLVSGGIGITPMQSVANDLLEQHARGRPLRSVFFVWSVRDRAMLGAVRGPGGGAARRAWAWPPGGARA